MIGIFDSGVGGFSSLRELRRLMPRADITYLADRDNSPYGERTREELIRLVKKDISILRSLGASRILIACCTASAVYPYLSDGEKEISFPIIKPSSEYAVRLGKRITVIATEYTAGSRAFSREISALSGESKVTEISAQSLVSLAEDEVHGVHTPSAYSAVEKISEKIEKTDPEVLILGCTHFSHLEKMLTQRLKGIKTVSPAVIGARAFYEELLRSSEENEKISGGARLRYL